MTRNLLCVKFAILFMLYLLSIITTMQQGKEHNANIAKVVTFVETIRAGSLKTEKVDAMTWKGGNEQKTIECPYYTLRERE